MARKPHERRGLGRGLSALMAEVNPGAPVDEDMERSRRADTHVAIERLRPNPDQPRRAFARDNLEELASSIREKGVIQPLIVRPDPEQPDSYQIVAGERRWRAAQLAQLHDLPVLIRDFDDVEVLEVAIIENIQRADLNPVEEAAGYRQLMDRFGHTQENLARALGKSRSHVANQMRLLALPEEVLEHLRAGRLSAGHARALITTENPVDLARRAVAGGLSVRAVERLAKGPKPKPAGPRASRAEKDADTKALEQDLGATLGMKVSIEHVAGGESGQMIIRYGTLEELDSLCQALSSMTRAGSI